MAIIKIQTVSGNGGAYTNSYTFGVTVTGGNTGTICMAYGAADNITITDNKSNVWVQDKQQVLTGQRQSVIWRATNMANGATTITVQADPGQFPDSAYIFDEWNDVTNTSPLDQTGGANTTSGTTYAAGSVTTTQTNELLIGAIAADSDTPSWTGDASWQTITIQGGFDLYTSIGRQYRIVSSTGSYSWTVTNGSSRQASQAVATYKANGSGTPVNSNFFGFM